MTTKPQPSTAQRDGKIQCVILAGGFATRMRPITETIPKALIPACGKPFVDHQLRWLASHGVTDVVLSVGYLGQMIRDFAEDGAGWGLRIRYTDEGKDLLGTAGALRLAFEQGLLEESFLVTYGDSYLPINFGEVFRTFVGSGATAMMTVYRNRGRWDSSNVVYDVGSKRVILYDKHRTSPQAAQMEHIDYGLSAFLRSTVEKRIPVGKKIDLAEVFHALSLEGQLAGLEARERFYEIGSPDGLRDFELLMGGV